MPARRHTHQGGRARCWCRSQTAAQGRRPPTLREYSRTPYGRPPENEDTQAPRERRDSPDELRLKGRRHDPERMRTRF